MTWKHHMVLMGIILLLAVVQTTLTPLIWGWARPDFLLCMAVLVGLFLDPATGAIYAFGTGYLADLLAGGTVGIFMFDRVVICMAANMLSRQFYARDVMTQFVLMAALAFAETLFIMLLSSVFGEGNTLKGLAWWHTPLRSLSTAIFGLPLYFIVKLIAGRTVIPGKGIS